MSEAKYSISEQDYICKSPVIFIFFNRPEPMRKVLAQIRKVRPQNLYFVADGPRNENEKNKTEMCRKIAESYVDWECNLTKIYAASNMGCKNRVSSGITQVLNIEERAIILEDDCVPDVSFFRFEDEMLERYKNEEQIFRVSGRNDLGVYSSDGDYIFSHRSTIWGWGTWARAWKKYDVNMLAWSNIKKNNNNHIRKILGVKSYYFMKKEWNRVANGQIDTWDDQWFFSMLYNNGYGITPTKNLIKNIGFDGDATHTNKKDSRAYIPQYKMEFPLKHPTKMIVDANYMKMYNKKYVAHNFFLRIIKETIKSIIRYKQ